MATVLPFKAIRPNPSYADQLVFTRRQAESVSGDYTKEDGLKPLKTLLETGARLRPETPEGQAMAYQDIRETLKNLVEKEQVWRETTPGIYVYEVLHQNYSQTGIWALTDLADYTGGQIKIHELTFADSVRRMKNYRQNTSLEGSPVLLTYPANGAVNAIIAVTKVSQPNVTLGNAHSLHRLWKIEDRAIQEKLMETFRQIGPVYLADGHHRLESAACLAAQQRKQGLAAYEHLSSLYMALDQLRIEAYHRVIVPDCVINKSKLLTMLTGDFYLQESRGNKPILPNELHRMGLYLDGQWYHLLAKPHTYEDRMGTDGWDAAVLQKQVLSKIFGIHDPKADSRLKSAGGEKALEEIGAIFQAHPQAIAFTLCPLTISELISAAEEGQILPPKSTWVVPKVPYGLLIHQHEI